MGGGCGGRRKRKEWIISSSKRTEWTCCAVCQSQTQIQFMMNRGCYQRIKLLSGTATPCERSRVEMNVANLRLMHYRARRPGVEGGEREKRLCARLQNCFSQRFCTKETHHFFKSFSLLHKIEHENTKTISISVMVLFLMSSVEKITWKFYRCRPNWLRWTRIVDGWALTEWGKQTFVARAQLNSLPPPAGAADVPARITGNCKGLHSGLI